MICRYCGNFTKSLDVCSKCRKKYPVALYSNNYENSEEIKKVIGALGGTDSREIENSFNGTEKTVNENNSIGVSKKRTDYLLWIIIAALLVALIVAVLVIFLFLQHNNKNNKLATTETESSSSEQIVSTEEYTENSTEIEKFTTITSTEKVIDTESIESYGRGNNSAILRSGYGSNSISENSEEYYSETEEDQTSDIYYYISDLVEKQQKKVDFDSIFKNKPKSRYNFNRYLKIDSNESYLHDSSKDISISYNKVLTQNKVLIELSDSNLYKLEKSFDFHKFVGDYQSESNIQGDSEYYLFNLKDKNTDADILCKKLENITYEAKDGDSFSIVDENGKQLRYTEIQSLGYGKPEFKLKYGKKELENVDVSLKSNYCGVYKIITLDDRYFILVDLHTNAVYSIDYVKYNG